MTGPATLRVVATHPDSQGPFVVIDAADYDAARHTLFEAADGAPETPDSGKPEKRPAKASKASGA